MKTTAFSKLATTLGLALGLALPPLRAHNLDQQDTSIAFDKVTLDMMAARAGLNQSLVQAGDSIGLILKSTPGPGTATGAGGYMTFYIPPGTQVEKADYGRPNGSGGFSVIPMKGPSIMAVGDGSVGSASTPALVGLTLGPNAAGVTSATVSATGTHNGTLAGVYGDVGIFFSTEPKTVWQSFVNNGGYDGNTGTLDNILTNNRGEARVPITKWDAEQLIAFGLSSPAAPVIDPNGRGNSPWGMASAVAGPQSGYQWAFNRDYYLANPSDPSRLKNSIVTGPWQRIQFPGSTIAKDQVGLKSSALGFATADASLLGTPVAPGTPLPATLNWTDSISPKAVRFSYGGLVLGQSEYARVQLKILAAPGQPNSPFDANGCFFMNTDTFGGDAGGEQGGKDHLWRYYDPTTQTINPCAMLQKQFAKTPLAPNELSYFELAVINTGTTPMNNVVVSDTMPSGLAYVSATPTPSSTSPLTFTLGTVPAQGFVKIRVNFTATGSGTIFNTATMTSSVGTTTAMDSVDIGIRSYLVPTKTVNPSTTVPGATVTYAIAINNIGTGSNGTPLVLTDILPAGFTYSGFVSAQLNGAAAPSGVVTVSGADPTKPVFTISQGIQPGKSLVINMTALISAGQATGTYGNTVSMNYEGKVVTSGSLAPITVGGGKIGDTIFRDWDGDGIQDATDEGIPGVSVQLWSDPNGDGNTADGALLQTKTTDSNGQYAFTGLTVANYVVKVPTPPSGYTQTFDPQGAVDNEGKVTLAFNQQFLTMDFGYKPGGTGSIGDTVFEDVANDGVQGVGDTGIPNITVDLFEDTNGNGAIDAADGLVATTSTNGSGTYLFSGLATGLNYIARVNAADADLTTYFNPNTFQASSPTTKSVLNLTGPNLTADFGFWRAVPGSIGDTVFADLDGNGIYNPATDRPLVGVDVKLYLDGVLVDTATSAADGSYLFANIGPGSYAVVVDTASAGVPAGYSPSVSQYPVSLTAGQNYLTADFPFAVLISKSVDKSYATAGQTLNFGINVDYPGSTQLNEVTVRDFVPAGTTFSSAGQGGTLTTFSSAAGVPGTDAGSSGGATVSVTAQTDIVDTWLDGNNTSTNYGSTLDIRVDPESSKPEHALVKFTLPTGIPSDAVVTSATLKLTKISGNTINITAHQADTPWVEAQASWNNAATGTAWRAAGGDYIEDATDPVVSSGLDTGDRNWTVTQIVQNWVEGQDNNGFLLKHPLDDTGNNSNLFASSEHATSGSRPTLTITYTSTARPATSTSISASPTAVAVGAPITVTMTVQANQAVANVVPTALTVTGGSATVSGPSPASRNLVANTPATFTWTVTPAITAELTFTASAGNGTVTFLPATSNSVLASPDGQTQYVSWNLGDNDVGTAGLTASSKFLYAFGGLDTLAFWTHNTATAVWNNPLDPADTPAGVTVNSGGALTNDGIRYIYALRGDSTRVFLRYDTTTNTWSDAAVADLPLTTDKVVLKGGSLVYLNGFVYAFLGNDSRQFWRYSVVGDTWTQVAGTLGTVNTGAGLTTDGTNLYATQGDGKPGFWRYNVGANTWTALTPFANNFGDGGGLAYANGAIYVVRGAGQKTFRRYNIGSNTWTDLALTLANVDDGGAMAYDGVCLYLMTGRSNLFYHYNPVTNIWLAQPTTPATTGWGGAMTYLATGAVSQTMASASPTFVSGVSPVTVRMTVTSNDVINGITANVPTYTATSGITATFSSATLASADTNISGAGDPVIYQWTATVTPGSTPGEITFTTSNSLGASSAAKTNSVIVSPTLTFVATVTAGPPAVINNTAYVADSGGGIPSTPSNTTETATGASIGDFVWADLDGDAVQDATEPGLPGVRVFIDQDSDGVYDVGEPNDVTNSDGAYRIFGLTAATYPVKLDLATLPAGYTPTTASTLSVVLPSNSTQYATADFGLRPSPVLVGTLPSSIGDTLWIDANENGVVDSGETLLANVTVNLYNDVNNSGTIDAGDLLLGSRSTDSSGNYRFTNLYSGNYLVDVDEADLDLPAGLERVSGGANGAGLHDVTLGTGIDHLIADFGYNYGGSIGDYLWYDLNGDKIQNNSGDGGPIPNAVVTLYQDANNNGALDAGEPIIGFTTTDINGAYLFDNLAPGNYIVKVEEQEVLAPPSSPFAGQPARMQASTGTKKAVTLAPGQEYVTADFGFLEVAKVEGHVFFDANGNAVLDPGEAALPNVTVTLTGTDQKGAPVSLTTTTDLNGEYKFLPPTGTYTVAYNTADPDIPTALSTRTTPVSFLFSIASGNELENLDFGVDNSGSIGDTIFVNPNSNATQDSGEPGLANAVVNLYSDAPRTVLLDSKVTDASGKYLFSGLADGTYYTQVDTVTLPAGYITIPTADSDATKDSLGTAIVAGGSAVLTQDFGYTAVVPTFAVTGTIFKDLNTNGVPNVPGEQLTGGTVTAVVTTGAVTQTFTTTTDSNGLYTFAGIPTGSDVTVTVRPATLGSPAYVQTVDPDASINNTTSLTNLTANVSGKDFGYVLSLGSIAGTVVKGDGDGLAESGELVQTGVTVTLIYAGLDGIEGTADDQTFTMPTNGTGDYLFTGLLPGNYSISTTVPLGFVPLADRDGTNPNSIALALTVGQNKVDQDFEYQASSISNYVWNDADGDGSQDANEFPLSGVRVYVDADGDNVYDMGEPNGTTNASGSYLIDGLASGTFSVRVDTTSLPAGMIPTYDFDGTGTPHKATVSLATNQNRTDVDFGYIYNSGITGSVLADTNNDDTGDSPLANVTLTLKNSLDNDIDSDPITPGVQPTTTTTVANGGYTFGNVPPGMYRVVETDPSGYTSVTSNIVTPVVVTAGNVTPGVNFVDEQPGSITGSVLADTNNDNIGDAPINGVTLTLVDSSGNPVDGDSGTAGVQPVTTTTNGSGLYSFTGLPPGTYGVKETQPSGYASVSDKDGGDLNEIRPIAVTSGTANTGNNFLEEQPGSISGLVQADTNNDNAGDAPLSGVIVTLKYPDGGDVDSDPNTAGIQPTTTITNGSGAYTFLGVPPGSYQVVETDPAGYNSVTPNTVTPVAVNAGANTPGVNFVDEQPGSITGSVLADTNNDNTGDAPIVGVTLSLVDSSGNPVDGDPGTAGVQAITTTTNGSGLYTFSNVPPGSYGVKETQPGGYASVSDKDAGDLNEIRPIAVTAGTTNTGNDFVEEQPGSISGTVLADTNNDNTGDAPLSGVTVTLKDTSGNDVDSDPITPGVQPTTATTNGSGVYSFPTVPPGSYQVVETDPSGYASVTPNTVTPVTVTANTPTPGVNFVDEQGGNITGSVLADTDNNDSGDAPLAGVVLTLVDSAGNTIDGDPGTAGVQPITTTSAVNGTYTFTGVPPGIYGVKETQPSGYTSISDKDGGDLDEIRPLTVTAGVTNSGNDFVEEQPSAISGLVQADTNNDNLGDTPMAGVTLTLVDATGNPVDGDSGTPGVQPVTTATAGDGTYSFTSLPPGTYGVKETQPSGYSSVSDKDGGDPNEIRPIVLLAGGSSAGNNFVEELPGSISGTVFADTDNNNLGDAPLVGVTLTLKDSSGNDVDSDPNTAGVQPTTTTTNGSGAYSFQGVPPGTYQVVETDPAGYNSVTPNTVTPVTVYAGAATPGVNFVDEQPGSITGSVLADTNNDNTGDAPINGVTLTLVDSSGNPVDGDSGTAGVQPVTTTTNGSGLYSFTGLPPGTYGVKETQPSGYASVSDKDGGDLNEIRPIAVTAGTANTGNNFVEEQPGSISGTVLADTNNDNTGDVPLPGVTLTLKDSSGNDVDSDPNTAGVQPTTTTTNGSGAYSFPGVPPGTYQVVETDPSGYASVTPNTVTPVTVTAGTPTPGVNFVDEQGGSITGSVLADTNNDNTGDAPISGVTLTLVDSSGNPVDGDSGTPGVQPVTTTTNGSGLYTFSSVPPGTYGVKETQPSGYASVGDKDGGDLNEIRPIAVTAGATNTGNHFVEEQPGSISGTVLADTNNDNTGDVPLLGVTVTLKDSSGNDVDSDPTTAGVQPTTTTTNGSGAYSFPGVPPGTYQVVETDPSGYASVTPNTVTPVTVTAGTPTPGVNFVDEQGGSITGSVLADTDNNDSGDAPLAGVVLTLVDSTGDPVDGDPGTAGVQPVTTTTAGDGSYTFTGVPPGFYGVKETQPSGYSSVSDKDGGNLDEIRPLTVTAGTTNIGNYFVEEQPSAISGLVQADTNNDNLGDTPIPGVTLTLVDALGNPVDGDPGTAGVQPITTTTAGDGTYSFTSLPPGTYGVKETQPSGYNSVSDKDGGDPNEIRPIVLLAGGSSAGNNFVEELPGSISGTVLADTDNNNLGEVPLVGVTLTLKDSSGNDVDSDPNTAGIQPTTTTTNGSGAYTFPGVPPGTYQVVETDPAGYNSVTPNTVTPVAVTAGAATSGVNFVDEQLGSITGFVFADTNNDNTGDTPIAVVTLTLVDSSGSPVDGDTGTAGVQLITATTNGSGLYSFTGLPPGTYGVKETQPSGYASVSDKDGGDLNEIRPIAVSAGAANTGNNFVEEQPGSISGTVLADTDNDNTGDAPMANVFLILVDSAGNPVDGDPNTGGVQLIATATAPDGSYTFSNVPPGTYGVKETQPSGYSSVSDKDGGDLNEIRPITVAAGIANTGNGFVERLISAFYTIRGQVRDDFDSDGILTDADSPVGGVTVQLYSDLNSNGVIDGADSVIATTQTNASGNYLFSGLSDGTYIVKETDPAGATSTADTKGSLVDNLIPVTIAGADSNGNDFLDAVDPPGYIYNAATGRIIPGGTITVSGPAPANILMNGITGQYSFLTNGTPGSYTISYTPPAGYVIDPTRPVTGGSFDPTGLPSPHSLGSEENPANPGNLLDYSAATNTYYLTFELAPGDPLVINNNIPLVQSKPTDWAGWQYKYKLSGKNSPTDNPDGDLYSNLLEFAFCFPPNSGINPFCPNEIIITPAGKVDFAITRINSPDVTITLEVAGSLGSPTAWVPAGALTTVVTDNGNGTTTVVFKDLESLGAAFADGDGFVRARIGIDTGAPVGPDAFDYTPVTGWTDHTHAGDLRPGVPDIKDQCTTFSMPYLKCALISGAATGNTATSIDLTNAVAGGGSVVGALNPAKRYFVEVTNGTLEGHRLEVDVAASTATSLALKAVSRVNTITLTPGSLAGAPVVVRELWTYNELFPPAVFLAGTNAGNSDNLLVYTGTGWKTYFLAVTNTWVLAGDVLLADQGLEILTPCEGIFLHRRGPSLTIARSGMVRESDFAKPLPGTGCTLVGSGYPIDQSYNSRGMTVANGWKGGVDLVKSSQVMFWEGDTTAGRMCYVTDFLVDAGAPLQFWASGDDSGLTNKNAQLLFDGTSAAFHCLPLALPNYVVPVQWYSTP